MCSTQLSVKTILLTLQVTIMRNFLKMRFFFENCALKNITLYSKQTQQQHFIRNI